ncbi:nucleoside diphosphate kinase regulator [Rhizobium sp. Root73]|uniref:nucleoside diphosphate kinase regulator n=1 Tax=unclassified Rhizobium TaxID=2613769 RepID=UPI00072A7D7B|nr:MULTISPECIES: nucleoside diphosphate kinase regulator [unclassified Rhizobium]KQY15031.1 nucleoside diphosphate kinase regulator [Rhizobium sp. Root1334]KRC06464.1 nucleoside diphosphate kinase regulator [Rhizobium sp. Root73]
MTTNEFNPRQNKPVIVVSDVDEARLSGLAATVANRMPDLSDDLLTELERAKVIPHHSMPEKVVRMGSTLEYAADDSQKRQVTLVYPGDADIAQGKISILTPIGTALIGLSEGQSIDWAARDGRRHRLTVITVSNVVEATT